MGAAWWQQLDVPRSADIIYKVCLHGPVRMTCALKNHAYGASVPAGRVCLPGQFYGNCNLILHRKYNIII